MSLIVTRPAPLGATHQGLALLLPSSLPSHYARETAGQGGCNPKIRRRKLGNEI